MPQDHREEIVDQALRGKAFFRVEGDDGKVREMRDAMLLMASIRIPKIEKFIKELARSSVVLFSIKKSAENPKRVRFHSRPAGSQFLGFLRVDMGEIEACFPNNTFNSYFEVFRKHTNNFYLKDRVSYYEKLYGEDLVEWVQALNACIDAIRQAVRTEAFSATIKARQRAANKNHKALLDYIDALFACQSRILVLRIDFSYKTEAMYGKDFQTSVDFPEIKEHHNRLIKHLKTKMFKDYFLGFASKFEYGVLKGYHFHSLIFLDGSQVREDIVIGKIIGDYWNTTLTDKRGVYFNCNANKDRYLHLGIGMINDSDKELVYNLKEYVAPYLNKTDYFIKLITPDNSRAFIKGNMIKPKAKKRGRPRTKTPDKLEDSFSPLVTKIVEIGKHGFVTQTIGPV